ncbi:MAG: hypothetical protein DRZ90_07660 [Spirochaetes bacterium]|nr:MAG: hypothetical protein DRZ90_07660 [Spirochaetota bacterium]
MKKPQSVFFLLILFILLIPSSALSAYDQIWGINLDLNLELPEVAGSAFGASTENTAGAWYRGRWSPAANMEIDGGVAFDGVALAGVTNELKFSYHGFFYSVYPELDKLNFYGNSGMFGYKAGRQLSGDPAGLIFDAPMDGIDFSVDIGEHVFTAGAGFTGLAFKLSSEYYMTQADAKRDSVLSSPRIMEYLVWDVPAATSWLNTSVYFLAMQDLTSSEDQDAYGSSRFNAMYLELYARGFLGKNFLYDLSLVGQQGKYGGDTTVLAGIGRLGFSWLPGAHSRLGVDIIGSTGDNWSSRSDYLLGSTSESELSQYLPLSIVSTQGFVVEFELGNLTSLGAFFAQRPSDTFSWELRTTTFMRSAIGPVSTGLVPSSSTAGHFLGQEGLVSFFWRPKSDFGWDFKLGVMYPGDPITLDTEVAAYFPVLYRLGFDWSWSF